MEKFTIRFIGLCLIGLLFMVGCSSTEIANNSSSSGGSTTFEANPCLTRGGVYVHNFYETSGDCGPLPDEVLHVPADGMLTVNANCTAGPNSRHEGCAVFIDQICNVDGATVKFSGKMNWSDNGDGGEGVQQVNITLSNGERCQSFYKVRAVRQ